MIVITRSDITQGYQAVQSCHSVADFAYEYPELFKRWKEDTNSIICLSTPDQKELLKLYDKLKDETESVLFFEPDINEYTSICVYGSNAIRRKLSKLPLLLKNKEKDVAI